MFFECLHHRLHLVYSLLACLLSYTELQDGAGRKSLAQAEALQVLYLNPVSMAARQPPDHVEPVYVLRNSFTSSAPASPRVIFIYGELLPSPSRLFTAQAGRAAFSFFFFLIE